MSFVILHNSAMKNAKKTYKFHHYLYGF